MTSIDERPPLSVRTQSAVSAASPGLGSSTSPWPSSASAPRNPLQAKVGRLLSANLEDGVTRAALDTLGQVELLERAEPETSTTTVDHQTRQPSQPASHGNADGDAGDITAALRKGGIRKEVDSRMDQSSREFLRAFSEVNDVRPLFHFAGMS